MAENNLEESPTCCGMIHFAAAPQEPNRKTHQQKKTEKRPTARFLKWEL
jgi:hypothetical protein